MIDVYKTEIDDGLKDLILSSSSIAYTTEITKTDPFDFKQAIADVALALEQDQPDLYYIYCILATLGWNLNDDIFLREEVVKAKQTPVDKPFNRMHNQDEIIGHMTSSRLLDSDYKEADDNTFEHIAVNSVIYKAWRDKEKKEEILQTIAEIQDGKWKVSMECLFSKFDYGIIAADGKQIIVERTPDTSYLTKHLRSYGGTGMYQNNRVGRVLRNITFCGKGLVDKPGNPYSIIFNDNKKFFGAVSSINDFRETRMNELELAKAELAKVQAELSATQAAVIEAKIAVAKEAEVKLTAALAERDTKIAALQADVTSTVAKLSDVNEKLTAAEAAKVELVVNLEKATAELASIKAAQTLASRKTALAAVVAPERVEALLAKIGSLNDEAFASVVESLAEFKPFPKKGEEDKEKKDMKKEDEAECKTKADFSQASLIETPVIPGQNEQKQKQDFQAVVGFMTNSLTKPIKAKKGDK